MIGRGTAPAVPGFYRGPSINTQIGRFLARTEEQRLQIFRLHLQDTIHFASPLLLDLLSHEGLSLTHAVDMIYPPEAWPWRPLGNFTTRWIRQALLGGSPHSLHEVRDFTRRFRNPGVIIRHPDHPRGRLAVRPAGDIIGFQAEVAGCEIGAFSPLALLKLPQRYPDTIALAMVGRTVDEIVDHPIFNGRDYRVRRVLTDLTDGLPVLVFRAAPLPFAMPWTPCRPEGES